MAFCIGVLVTITSLPNSSWDHDPTQEPPLTLLVITSLCFFFLTYAAIIYHLDYTIYFCHTCSMLDSHSAEHIATNDRVTTNETCKRTHELSVVSCLLLLLFSFQFGTKPLLSLSLIHHFHLTSSAGFER